MMKRVFDFAAAAFGLAITSPLLLAVMVAIWLEDRRSPFYIARRVARGGGTFRMVKFRSMTVGADRTGVSSTAANDARITRVGGFVRKYKLDEVIQLWNVLKGDMSLVGPRPQVPDGVRIYTDQERRMLDVRPGITDPASIVFSDESEILRGSDDPDLLYNQIIRPWKSRLALLYIEHASLWTDVRLIVLTVIAVVSRRTALAGVQRLLEGWDADELLCTIASRGVRLTPYPPPGAAEIVTACR
jgi:lipopolysaccharide/colanic/teichoic acid biosynthesis glycosyltransferase